MTKDRKKQLRGILFQHLDGITLCSTIATLFNNGITQFILENKTFTIQDILSKYECNAGYMNVALRLLASQGWLKRNIIQDGEDIEFHLTEKGVKGLAHAHYYDRFYTFIPFLIDIDKYLFDPHAKDIQDEFQNLQICLDTLNSNVPAPGSTEWDVSKHLEGLLVGPILVALGMSDFFLESLENESDINLESMGDTLPIMSSIFSLFIYLKWIVIKNSKYYFSEEGRFFIKRSTAYGVTVSYLPTFNQMPELLFGNPNVLWKRSPNGLETHVNRHMNVWGSGGAHSLYFRKIDEIITHIFNKPLDEQPIGIADMGCGDGTLLKHLFEVVKNKTERGKHLHLYPIKIIGADFNKAARLASTITLQEAKIEHSILHGDISNPADYAKNLKQEYGLDLQKMLNVRSFLDHNRIYSPPKKTFHDTVCNSTGAFAFRGRWIPNKELKQNLIEHFSSWHDYVSKYGLLILELHTIPPEVTAHNLGSTVATAYDGTHGYSDQYIIEVDTMLDAAKKAGLIPEPKYQALFPSEELATISINLFKAVN
jgi:hypothetical protein